MTTEIPFEDRSRPAPPARATSEIATRPQTRRLGRNVAFWSGLAVLPTAVGSGIAALTGSRRTGLVAGGLTAIGLAAVRWQLQRLFNDQPEYEVERTIGTLEIRRYLPRVEARTRLADDDFDAALEEGFLRLAGYIFGGNRAGERLAMTSPVTSRGDQRAAGGSGGYQVAFVMPPDRPLATLPRPTDNRIELVEVPERRVAVLTYRGRYHADAVAEHSVALRHEVAAAGLAAKGEPMFAGFDPPSTLPFLRRNEIWIELV